MKKIVIIYYESGDYIILHGKREIPKKIDSKYRLMPLLMNYNHSWLVFEKTGILYNNLNPEERDHYLDIFSNRNFGPVSYSSYPPLSDVYPNRLSDEGFWIYRNVPEKPEKFKVNPYNTDYA